MRPPASSEVPTALVPTPSPVANSATPIVPTPPALATPEPSQTRVSTPEPSPTAPPASPTPEPTATAEPSATPEPALTPEAIGGYTAHVVADGETLEQIAERGGSTPELISAYNLLSGAPQPGRALIIPQIAGRASELANEPVIVERGSTARPWVALTLDAGAGSEPVGRMLDTLRERGVTITFFLTGKWIDENPELARRIVADGHEIANHTVNHPDLRTLDDQAIRAELSETDARMLETTGSSTRPFFRPPYGAYDERVLQLVQAEGYLPVYWTLDSLDSVGEPKSAEFLLERITRKLTPEQLRGAIILAHCGSAPTADALPAILDRFNEMGFEVKKLSEVLKGD